MIFLNILKIIGFVLLGILALILIILLLVLLWPFQYKIEADYHEKFKAKAVVSFLFKLVRVIFTFEDGKPLLVAKVLFFKVYENDFSGEELTDESMEGLSDEELFREGMYEEPENVTESGDADDSTLKSAGNSGENPAGEDSGMEGEETEELSGEEEPYGLTDREIEEFMEEELPKQSPRSFIDEFFDNIEKIIQKIHEKWYNLIRDLRKFRKKATYYQKVVKYYWRVLHHKSMQPAFRMVKKTIAGILKHVRPRKIRIKLHYGSEDPAQTAKAVAVYSMIYPYYPKQIVFHADFNNKIIEGSGYIKGHFQLGVLAFYAVRAYLNKHVRKMIKLFTREGKKHG